jgi:putative hydrolase of the HAD superfamily
VGQRSFPPAFGVTACRGPRCHAGRVRTDHRFRAVLFDVDGTLLDHDGAALRALLRWLPKRYPSVAVDPDRDTAAWLRAQEEHYPRFAAGEIDFTAQRRARVRSFCLDTGRAVPDGDEEADEWWRGYLPLVDGELRAYPDAAPVLRRLRRDGVRVCAVSNSDPRYQRSKLDRVGLGELVPHLVCCADAGGLGKPHPAIFHAGLRAVGAEPGEALHVGDDLARDARAARAAGIAGVWLNRGPDRPAPDDVPVIGSLRELLPLLLLHGGRP